MSRVTRKSMSSWNRVSPELPEKLKKKQGENNKQGGERGVSANINFMREKTLSMKLKINWSKKIQKILLNSSYNLWTYLGVGILYQGFAVSSQHKYTKLKLENVMTLTLAFSLNYIASWRCLRPTYISDLLYFTWFII